ncbi:MAG: hypothetical protein ABFD69_10380 [Candidatus Sumerlaeia bacterium]
MQLPRNLTAWAEALNLFPRDVALGIGGLARRLAPAFRALRETPILGREEPDGYAGLHRRGPLDRLIPSELVWADEMPEEFERRAVMGEQLFFRRKMLDKAGSIKSIALFDAGPGQLGAPRIAQIAVLILLERRARAAGADFGFGILQNPRAGLKDELTVASIESLLRARSAREVDDELLQSWNEILPSPPERRPDLWIVGENPAAPGERPAGLVSISDVYQPGERTLSVRVMHSGRETAIALPLPPDPVCTRIIRDPFFVAAPPPPDIPKGKGLPRGQVLFVGLHRLLVPLDNGAAAIYPIPECTPKEPIVPRIYRPLPGHEFVAIECRKKLVMSITRCRGKLYFNGFPDLSRDASLDEIDGIDLAAESPALRPAYGLMRSYAKLEHSAGAAGPMFRGDKNIFEVYFVDDSRRLICVSFAIDPKFRKRKSRRIDSAEWSVLSRDVVALGSFHTLIQFASWDKGSSTIQLFHQMSNGGLTPYHRLNNLNASREPVLQNTLSYIFGFQAATWTDPHFVELIEPGKPNSLLGCERDDTLLGIVCPILDRDRGMVNKRSAMAVLLNGSRKVVRAKNAETEIVLPAEQSPIKNIAVETYHSHVAWLNADGELVVYSIPRKELLLRVKPGEAGS